MRTKHSRALDTVPRIEPASSVLSAEAAGYIEKSRAAATRRAYLTDANRFEAWCAARGLSPLPASAESLANFLSWMATSGFKVASIERNLVAVSVAHRELGFESPRRHELVRNALRGIRRTLGVAPQNKRALVATDLRAMLAATDLGLKGIRDRALLSLAFVGALRRSEVVALNVPDLEFKTEGILIAIRRSKADQEGAGAVVAVPYGACRETCPVRLVQSWLAAARVSAGPVFRAVDRHGNLGSRGLSAKAVATVTKELAAMIGIDPRSVGAHSLRAGLVTSAMGSGKPEHAVMKHTRHSSVSAFRCYIRDASAFTLNAAVGIGL
jgi:site-specific recombinase XerD